MHLYKMHGMQEKTWGCLVYLERGRRWILHEAFPSTRAHVKVGLGRFALVRVGDRLNGSDQLLVANPFLLRLSHSLV